MGDPAGIGGELTLKAWLARRHGVPFVALDDPARLQALAHRIGLDVPIRVVNAIDAAGAVFRHALPVLPVPLAAVPCPGTPDPANAAAVIASIEQATMLALAGTAAGVVTNPIHKSTLYDAGFPYPGHTEFLAALTGAKLPVMMLASPLLRVVPITVHASLRRMLDMITVERIVAVCRVTDAELRTRWKIPAPWVRRKPPSSPRPSRNCVPRGWTSPARSPPTACSPRRRAPATTWPWACTMIRR